MTSFRMESLLPINLPPIASLILGALLGGILSWVIAWYYYKKSVRNKQLTCYKRELPPLSVAKRSQEAVAQIERSYGSEWGIVEVLLQNEGETCIEPTDISRPIKVLVNGEIKEWKINGQSTPEIGVQCHRESDGIAISFKYLDRYDGVVVHLVVRRESMKDIKVTGGIKNSMKKFECKEVSTFTQVPPSAGGPSHFVFGMIYPIGAVGVIWIGWYFIVKYGIAFVTPQIPSVDQTILGVFVITLTILVLYFSLRLYWRILKFVIKMTIDEMNTDWSTRTESRLPTKWKAG